MCIGPLRLWPRRNHEWKDAVLAETDAWSRSRVFVVACIRCAAGFQLFEKIDFGSYFVYHNELLVVSDATSASANFRFWFHAVLTCQDR